MLIRVQFTEVDNKNVVQAWSLFVVPENDTLLDTFRGICSDKYSCGRELDFSVYDMDEVVASVATSKKMPTNSHELMPAPMSLKLYDIKENHSSLYIQYDLKPKRVETESTVEDEGEHPASDPLDSITNVLMNRKNCYVSPKSSTNHQDVQQFNALVSFVKEKKCGVRPTSLDDFSICIQTFSSLLWEVDPHYDKFKARGIRFIAQVEKNLLGFNNPKKHGHPVKPIKIQSLMSKATTLSIHVERKYMFSSHMKLIVEMITSVVDCVCRYNEYLQAQNVRVSENQADEDEKESSLDNYSVKKLKQVCGEQKQYINKLSALKSAIESSDVYVPIVISDIVKLDHRYSMCKLIKSIREIGFPKLIGDFTVYYFRLPSQGPNSSVNFVWKSKKDDKNSEEENTKIVVSLHEKQKRYYSRATRRTVRNILYRIGIKKTQKAEYLLRSLLGDASAPNDENQKGILQRLNQYVSLGEDVICDLRQNNGRIPKYDKFWEIVERYIEDKTAIDDRRHSSEANNEIVVSMAIATSYADMYRQCSKIAAEKEHPVEVPSPNWFMLQFWPSSKTLSSMTHYTGRFKVKRMVQARLLRNNNPDSHYANAVYSFMKERAVKNSEFTAMLSVDAKCKVSVGEPDFPIAAVSRGKAVIVGENQTFKVGDHDFSKVSMIPDATLIHTIPNVEENEDGDVECNKHSVGAWYSGNVFYSVKDMATEGSSAMRGATETSVALIAQYQDSIPPRLSLFADGAGDRKNTNFKVQKGLISLFLKHDLDEVVAARPAAGHSYRNPVERCHCIANLGLQSVGMMRSRQDPVFEQLMKKCNGNADVRKECESNKKFKEGFLESIRGTRELLENVLQNLSLKDVPFTVLPSATEDDEEDLVSNLNVIDEKFTGMSTMTEIKNVPNVKEFYVKHCVSRTYYFQIRKCNDTSCRFHKPIRGNSEIDIFPDPVPNEVDGVLHYEPGTDAEEKFLPSKLEDAEKGSHNIPFPPSGQTAKNVGFIVKCLECDKSRLLHSKYKLKSDDQKGAKRMMSKVSYMCGSVLSEYLGTGNDRDEKYLKTIFARENISCSSKIELPYYTVDFFPKICIYCGILGTSRTLGNSTEHYPKCIECGDRPDVVRRKRKAVVASDLINNKKKK